MGINWTCKTLLVDLCGFGLSFAMGRDQTVWLGGLGSSKGEPSGVVEGGWNGIKMEATWCQ